MVIVGFVLVLGFGAVITNLVRLQLVNGETLKTDAVDQSLQSTQLTPSRGTIYDATGTKVLAQSASVWTVALEPNYIDEGDDVKIAKGLSEILGLDYDAVLKKAQQNSYFVYVKRKVETEVRDEIVQYIKDEKIGRGITLMEDYKRYYPYGTTASTVLGFTGTDNQGLAGVETEYDSELSGTAGRLVSAKNAQGDDMPFQYDQYVQAQDGYDLVLTIDETAQSIVEKHLQAGLEACGALEGGTAVLMNVKTGAILALSTKGDYDPNDPFTISQEAEDAIPEKVEDALQKAQEKEQQELNTLQLAIDNAETDEARAKRKKPLRITSASMSPHCATSSPIKCGPKHRISSGETKPSAIRTTPAPFSKWSRAPWQWNPAWPPKTPRTPAPVSGCLMIPPSTPSAVGTTPVTARKRWWTAFAIPATRT